MPHAIYHRCRILCAAMGAVLGACAVGLPAAADPGPPGVRLSEAWVTVDNAASLGEVEAAGLTIDHGRLARPGGGFEQRVIAPPDALASLRARGFTVRVSRQDHRRGAPRAGYRSPDEGHLLLAQLAATSPRGGVIQLGESVQGRPIQGLWLGVHPDDGAPTWRLLAAHHGDEWSSFEVALDAAETLVARDGTDAGVTALLDTSTVWIVPYVNPDGVVQGTRYNASVVDLNRNYGFSWTSGAFGSGSSPFSEPETTAVRIHALYGAPLASLSLHSGATNIGYVWNYSYQATAEEALLEDIGLDYDALCTTPGFWVTNGADWYTTTGDTNDWSYGRYGGMDYTVEVTSNKSPAATEIPTFVGEQREAVIGFLTTPISLAGEVTDASSGAPIEARLWLEGSSGPTTAVFTSHAVAGTFHRIAEPGVVTLHVEAEGWVPAQVPVTIGDPASLALSIPLRRGEIAADPLPSPVVSPSTTRVPLPAGTVAGGAVLSRPGEAPRSVPVLSGEVVVDHSALVPGPWTLTLDDDTTWPRGLFVTASGPARATGVDVVAEVLTVAGEGFAAGTRAWTLQPPLRTLVVAPVLSESDTELVIDVSGVPPGENADLLVLSNGTQLLVEGIVGDPTVDTGPVDDTGPRQDTDEFTLNGGGCGCNTPVPSLSFLTLLPLAWLVRRRRP